MKLHFQQADLAESVNIVLKAVPSKTTMPLLSSNLRNGEAQIYM